jgi:lysozyme
VSKARIVVGALTLSAVAFGSLVDYEGYSDRAIIPIPGDVPTLGFGTTAGVKIGDRITPPQAVHRALTDVAKFEGALKQCVTAPLHQYEYDAALLLSYNIGPTAFCKSTVVRRFNAGDYAGACDAFLMWNKAGGKVVRGLQIRRERERAMCLGQHLSQSRATA